MFHNFNLHLVISVNDFEMVAFIHVLRLKFFFCIGNLYSNMINPYWFLIAINFVLNQSTLLGIVSWLPMSHSGHFKSSQFSNRFVNNKRIKLEQIWMVPWNSIVYRSMLMTKYSLKNMMPWKYGIQCSGNNVSDVKLGRLFFNKIPPGFYNYKVDGHNDVKE